MEESRSHSQDHRGVANRGTEKFDTNVGANSFSVQGQNELLDGNITIKQEITEEEAVVQLQHAEHNIFVNPHQDNFSVSPQQDNEDIKSTEASTDGTSHVEHTPSAENLLVEKAPSVDAQEQDKSFRCPICNRRFRSPQLRQIHRLTMHEEPRYECQHCDRKFYYKCRMLKHSATHDKVAKQQKTTKRQRKLIKEETKDAGSSVVKSISRSQAATGGKVKCPYCFNKLPNAKVLDRHIRHCGPRECEVCNKKFARYHQFTYHVKKYHNEIMLSCPHCPRIFIDKTDFTCHSTCCAKWKYRCDHCGLKFKREYILVNHTRRFHKTNNTEDCSKLPSVGGDRKVILEDTSIHIKTEIILEESTLQPQDFQLEYPKTIRTGPNRQFPCPICKKVYRCQSTMHYHKRVHMLPRLKCSKCEKLFHIKSLLLKHMKSHQRREKKQVVNNQPQPCPICDKIFASKFKLRAHMKWSHTERRLKCPHCDKSFHVNLQFKRHLQVHEKKKKEILDMLDVLDKDPDKVKVCKICGLPFANIVNRQRHMRRAHAEHRFKCLKCQRSFVYKSTLERHELAHLQKELGLLPPQEKKQRRVTDPIKSKTCEKCNLQFLTPQKKHHHMIKVHAEKKFKCPQCPKAFHYIAYLTRHQLSHEDKKKKCTICGREFKYQARLARHLEKHPKKEKRKLSTHTNIQAKTVDVKSEMCSICGLEFDAKYKLRYHRLSAHTEPQFKCELCSKSFFVISALLRHNKVHQNKKLKSNTSSAQTDEDVFSVMEISSAPILLSLLTK